MDDREDFLEWFRSTWWEAEVALHRGDPGPRFETWSRHDPVSLFGAWFNATGVEAVHDAFLALGRAFSGVESAEVELVAVEVHGDLATTAHREVTEAVVDGRRRRYTLRVTQVYRREDGHWRVVHRHGDEESRSTG